MPFVQMENISHYLRACQMPPLSLPDHDVFQTVDLYESKDPAQVLQCVAAFSRRANAVQPSRFPRAIGVQNKGGSVSPHLTGSSQGASTPAKSRGVSGVSAASSGSGQSSPGKSPPPVSSWSKKSDQHATMPAWNIHQYGYMGGASQANQGVMFGAPRQITTAAPAVPGLAEKEKRRREEEESSRLQKQEEEVMRQRQREADEERARVEEERRWDEETARLREKERREVEEERKRWDEEQRQWEEEERRRLQEEREVEERFERERQRRRDTSDARLNGQFLSQFQASQATSPRESTVESKESQRIKELERQLEHAKERELRYEAERQQARQKDTGASPPQNQRPRPVPPKPSYDLSSLEQERRMLRTEWQKQQDEAPIPETPNPPQALPSRPLPDPSDQKPATETPTSPPSRPLPDPAAHSPNQQPQPRENRVDRFLTSNRPPTGPKPATHRPQDFSTTAEVDAENNRRQASQEKTRAGGWASKSLLEREMERERERQREWEENQRRTQEAAAKGRKDGTLGSGPGQAWDVHQYGYMGGDNQNRVGPGLGIGGARRQIIGPRPPP